MPEELRWRELHLPRPLDGDQVMALLTRLASQRRRWPIVFELRRDPTIRYLIGALPQALAPLARLAEDLIPGTQLSSTSNRRAVRRNVKLRRVGAGSVFNLEQQTVAARSLLQTLTAAEPEEVIAVQLILGPGTPPRCRGARVSAQQLPLDLIFPSNPHPAMNGRKAPGEPQFGFRALLRAGASAATPLREQALLTDVLAALRTLEDDTAGIDFVRDRTAAIDEVLLPRLWPLAPTVPEALALMGWPLGDAPYPGLPSGHPRPLRPNTGISATAGVFATATAPGFETVRLGFDVRDRLRHGILLGPTESGKSTVLLNLIVDDIRAGRSAIVLDPQANLVRDVLERAPAARADDVVVIDPTQPNPVGFNPLSVPGSSPELVADGILAIFKELFASAFGPRTTDIMHAALLTLAHHGQASLVWLPRLLTDPVFRRRLTATLDDPIGLEPFWAQYEALSAGQQAAAIAPGMSRLRQLLLRPSLREVLGQITPRFQPADVFQNRAHRIVLIPLNKALVGPEAAKLLGSLLLSTIWQLTLSRAALPPDARSLISVYVDEAQDFMHLPVDLSEALSRSRAMGVSYFLAHQFRAQMPPGMLAAIDANARQKIIFGLDANDAAAMAKHAPGLEAVDFQSLGPHEIYARFTTGRTAPQWVSARTLPPPSIASEELALRARSQARYGGHPTRTDLGLDDPRPGNGDEGDEPIGRRQRGTR